MPSAPEVEHLQRAVDAVRKSLLPEKKREPINEGDITKEPDQETEPEPEK